MKHMRRLQVLAAVGDAGTFSSAAHELGITQSAVSQHVAALERELDAVLVDRGSRPVQLTQVGLRLADLGRAVSTQLSAAEQAVLQLLGHQHARLRVGLVPLCPDHVHADSAATVPTRPPRGRSVLVDSHMPRLLDLLDSGAIDVAVV